jgi:hypothetical protein
VRLMGVVKHESSTAIAVWRFFCPWNRISFGLVGRDSPVDELTQ